MVDNKLEHIVRYYSSKTHDIVDYLKPDKIIIWLHGLGANCHDFENIIPALNLNFNAKFIFPNAPMIPITINGGYVMQAWYDIISMDFDARVDSSGAKKSAMAISELIIDEMHKEQVSSKQIIVAGFSQGGLISYLVGLNAPNPLGAVIALSSYLPEVLKPNIDEKNSHVIDTPFFIAHGTNDTILPYEIGYMAYKLLKNDKINATWHQYSNMGHCVCDDEINALKHWLQSL